MRDAIADQGQFVYGLSQKVLLLLPRKHVRLLAVRLEGIPNCLGEIRVVLIGQKKGIAPYFKEIVDPEVVGFPVQALSLSAEGLHDEVRLAFDSDAVRIGQTVEGSDSRHAVTTWGRENQDDVVVIGVDSSPANPIA